MFLDYDLTQKSEFEVKKYKRFISIFVIMNVRGMGDYLFVSL
jgi:hypothetical protein